MLAPSPYAGRPNTATHEITYRDEPEPAIDEGDALIGIDAVGICAVHDLLNEAPLEESGFELVFDAVGIPATRQAAIRAVRPDGVIVHVGLQENGGEFDMRKLTLAEITLIGVYTYTPDTLRASLAALHQGRWVISPGWKPVR